MRATTKVRTDTASFSSEAEPGITVNLIFPEDHDVLSDLCTGTLSIRLAHEIVAGRRRAIETAE